MQIFKHQKCNSLVTPADHDAGQPDMPVHRVLGENGRTKKIESFWKPTSEELKKLQDGQCIRMTRVVGLPITLDVVPK